MPDLIIQKLADGVSITAKIVPGSSRTALAGTLNGMLKIKIASPAEKGKANQALIKFLASKLGLKNKDIEIISGQTNPVKQLKVASITPAMLTEKLGLAKHD